MRTIVQRVREAAVRVDGEVVGAIGPGLLLLVGVERGDGVADAEATATKVAALRCFAGRTPMDHALPAVGGACLVVSQFTLAASLRRGNRPGFERAAEPESAAHLVEEVVRSLRGAGLEVATGRFGATMEVALVNDGPVTFVLDARGGRIVDARPSDARPSDAKETP